MFNNTFLYIKRTQSAWVPILHRTKNCYLWFPMISGHGTENMLSMGFEILELDLVFYKIPLAL